MVERRLFLACLLLSLCAWQGYAALSGTAAFPSPGNGTLQAGNVTVNVTFSGMANVTVESNVSGSFTLLSTSDSQTGSLSFTWPTSNGSFPDGAYSLRAVIVNSSNQTDNQTIVSGNITVDNTPPSVAELTLSVSNPGAVSTLVNITVNVTDQVGVGAVNLNNGSNSVLMVNASPGVYTTEVNLSALNCQPEALCRLTILADDTAGNTNDSVDTLGTFNASSLKYLDPLFVDSSPPSIAANAAVNATGVPGSPGLLSVRWSDVSLNVQEGPRFTVIENHTASSANTTIFNATATFANGYTERNHTNYTFTHQGSDEGYVTYYNLTLNDSNDNQGSFLFTVTTQNASPTFDVVSAANSSVLNTSSALRFTSIEVGVGLNISELAVNISQGAGSLAVTYGENASLFDCSCAACNATQASADNSFVANYTCEMSLNWTPQGLVNVSFSVQDFYGNTNTSHYAYTVTEAPDIVNVTVNGATVLSSTPDAGTAVSVSNASRELTFGWTVSAGAPINATTIAFANVSNASALSLLSLPASAVYNVTAGKNYLTINVTLNDSLLTDAVQLNLTANVPLNLSALSDQYTRFLVSSWSVEEDGTDVTQQERFVNATFDIIVNVSNGTAQLPFTARLNYSGQEGLGLRWNASATSFTIVPVDGSTVSSLSSQLNSNVTLAIAHDGQTGVFFDSQEYLLSATFNVSIMNRTPYYQERSSETTYLLEACGTAPSEPIDASSACYTNTTSSVTLWLPRFDFDDRILFGELDGNGPNVTFGTPSIENQSVVELVLNVTTPNPNTTLCFYNLSAFNATTNVSTTVAASTVASSFFAVEASSWVYRTNVTGADDGQYSFTATCADTQGQTGQTNATIQVNDTTAPTVSDVTAGGITASAATIAGSADEAATFTVFYGTAEDDLDSSAAQSGTSQSASVGLSDLDADTLYYYNLTACDAKNQCASSNTSTFRTLAGSTSGRSGGGGAGGEAETLQQAGAQATETRVWQDIAAGDAIDYAPKGMAITRVLLEFANASKRVEVSLNQYDSQPDGVTDLPLAGYKFVEIRHKGLEQASRYLLEFTVSKTWTSSVLADTIALYRLESGEWRPHEAVLIDETSEHYAYSATVPGFSWFAIAAEPQKSEDVQVQNPPTAVPEAPIEEQPASPEGTFVSALERGGGNSRILLWTLSIVVLAGLLVVGGLKTYKLYQKREEQHARKLEKERESYHGKLGNMKKPSDRSPEHDPMAPLHAYILKMREHGYDNEHIRKRLHGAGWDAFIIEQELERATPRA